MSKERLTTFIDAVLAIVMTILVLELKLPEQITVGGFWALRDQFIAYFISFFWIGTMWVGLHNNWHRVKSITRAAPWLGIVLLFFSSLVPYATRIVSAHFMSVGAQVFYGLIIIGVTLANLVLYRSVLGDAPRNRLLFWDVVVKCVALLLSFVFPPTMLIVTLLAGVFWVVMGLTKY